MITGAITYIIFFFAAVQMTVALVNLAFREKPVPGKVKQTKKVSVLIPARNEENNIGNLLSDLLMQDYSNIEIIVFDDLSEDRTAEIVLKASEQESRIRLLRSEGLPAGWLGKNYACHMLSASATCEYLLFLDADVRIGSGAINNIVAMAERHSLSLISVFPKQVMLGPGEKSTVPVMNFILLTLLPLIAVRKTIFPSLSAANGQLMLFRASDYFRLKPHETLRYSKVEDIYTARLFKSEGLKIACLTGDKTITCRMYSSFREGLNGFSKNMAAFFGGSLLLAFVFWLITTFGVIPVIFYGDPVFLAAYVAMLISTRILVSLASEQPVKDNLVYWIPQQVSAGLIILQAFNNSLFGKFRWKGREII